MKALYIDLPKLRRASRGNRDRIASVMGIDTSTLTRKWRGQFKMTLDDLNTICTVIRREPVDFLATKENEFLPPLDGPGGVVLSEDVESAEALS